MSQRNPTGGGVVTKKPLELYKKSKVFASNKNDFSFTETLYDRLDITRSCGKETIEKKINVLFTKEQNQQEKAAYQEIGKILTDPERRAMYDLTRVTAVHDTSGVPGLTHHSPGFHQMAREIITDSNLVRVPDVWHNPNAKARDVKHNLKCTLEEFYNGKTVKLKIARFQLCTLCAGKGIIPNPNLAHNPIQSHQICSSCSGKKSVRVPNELEFVLTPGSRNGYRKRLKGQGDAPGNLQPADIYLVVEQKPHTNFTRLGSDLYALITLTLNEHFLGCTKYIQHLQEVKPDAPADKKAPKRYQCFKVRIPPLKRKLVLENKGMPILTVAGTFGNLILDIIVDYPEKIDKDLAEKLSNILPDASLMEVENQDMNATIDTAKLSKLEKIGLDEIDNSKDDHDKVSDGVDKCPVS